MSFYEYFRAIILTYLAFVAYEQYCKINGQRKCWVREIYQNRDLQGFFERTFKIIKRQDSDEFFKATRMTVSSFDLLLKLLEDRLCKHSLRKPIEPECRLALTLFYLANGDTRQDLALNFRMGVSTVASIINETCSIICDMLGPIYLTTPTTQGLKQISKDFLNRFGLPNCVGVLGYKFVPFGKRIYTYKNRAFVTFLAAIDANDYFTAFDIISSKESGEETYDLKFSFKDKILGGITGSEVLPNSDMVFPYYLVGDRHFPLKCNLMRPYPGKQLPAERNYYNEKIEEVILTFEKAFGIICERWKVLSSDLNCSANNLERILTTVIILHNFLKQNEPFYCLDEQEKILQLESDGKFKKGKVFAFGSNNATREAFGLRDQLCSYLYNRSQLYTQQL